MTDPTELDYGLDFQGRRRFYGIYSAVVLPGTDPKGRFAIQLQIPGPSGMEKTSWAKACLPVTDNSYHPDHQAHTAAKIAALLSTASTLTISSVIPSGAATTYRYSSATQQTSSGAPIIINGGVYKVTSVATITSGSVYSFTVTDPPEATTSGSSGTAVAYIPASPIIPNTITGQLNHPHTSTNSMVNTSLQVASGAPTSTADTLENSKYTSASGLYAPGTSSTDTSKTTPEHTFHRTVPQPGQKIWVMFEAGDPEYPVWIGVQA